MEESEDNMSTEDVGKYASWITVKSKPKKRSLVERELETNLTARVTSPDSAGGSSTSRYGRARRHKTGSDIPDGKKALSEMKSPAPEESPQKSQSPVYKMHASNSPLRTSSPKKAPTETFLESQIESIYQENISLSRFGTEEVASPSPAKKFPKVYIRKDLIQKRDAEETVMLIKNMFSPVKSSEKRTCDTHLNNVLERSSERFSLNSSVEKSSEKYSKSQKVCMGNPSVVKTLDFDTKKKRRDCKETRTALLSKSELFDLEANCAYQVGDLAWARMGTYPFWPCIITRDPGDGIFVKKKLFGRIERDVIHVTFFGDNGRRGWIVDSMLRKYQGQLQFEATREQFTPEEKKKDPRLYAAFFVSEKKQALWNISVEEAEMLLREPKRLRIDIFHDMLEKSRAIKPSRHKSSKISRTNSDVSLSESLYDSLFSEDDGKSDNHDHSRRSKNKSLDVFDVVTACLDNMAAKSGITKIQKQSHMDRWLQKAKSKTPEKPQASVQIFEKEIRANSAKKKKKTPHKEIMAQKPYRLRRSGNESHQKSGSLKNEDDFSSVQEVATDPIKSTDSNTSFIEPGSGIGIIAKVVSLRDKIQEGKTQNDEALIKSDDCVIMQEHKDTNDKKHKTKNTEDELNHETKNTEDEFKINCLPDSTDCTEMKTVNEVRTDCSEENIAETVTNELTENCKEIKETSVDDVQETSNDSVSLKASNESAKAPIDYTKIELEEDLQGDTLNESNILITDSKILEQTQIESGTEKTGCQEDMVMIANDERSEEPRNMYIDNSCGSVESIPANQINETSSQSTLTCQAPVVLQTTRGSKSIDIEKTEITVNIDHNNLNKNECHENIEQPESTICMKGEINNSTADSEEILNTNANHSQIQVECENSTNVICKTPKCGSTEGLDSKGDATRMISKKGIQKNVSLDNESTQLYDVNSKKTVNVKIKSGSAENGVPKVDIKHLSSSLNEFDVKVLIQDNVQNNYNKTITSAVVLGNNIFIDDDSDDEPLPYSPLSVDLNKDNNLDEMNEIDSSLEENCENKDKDSCHEEHKNSEILIERMSYLSGNKSELVNSPKIGIERLLQADVNGLIGDTKNDNKSTSSIVTNNRKGSVEEDNNLCNDYDIYQNFDKPKSRKLRSGSYSSKNTRDIVISNNISCKGIIIPNLGDNELQLNLHSDQRKEKITSCEDFSTANKQNVKNINEVPNLFNSNAILSRTDKQFDDSKNTDSNENIVSDECNKNDEKIEFDNNHKLSENPIVNGYANEKLIPDIVKENCGHNTDSINNDLDADTPSKSDHKRNLTSMQDQKLENPMDNVEFVKYLELRQDSIMDENPELSYEEIQAYLYKTWLYEENLKTDTKKNDDLHQSTLVKGLHKDITKKRRRNLGLKRTIKNNYPEGKTEFRGIKESIFCKSNNAEMHKKKQFSIEKSEISSEAKGRENAMEKEIKTENDKCIKINKKDSPLAVLNVPAEIDDDLKDIYKNGTSSATDLDIIESKSKDNCASTTKSKLNKHISDSPEEIDESIDSKEKSKQVEAKNPTDDSTDVTQFVEEKRENDVFDTESVDSEDSEAPLIRCKLRSLRNKTNKEPINNNNELNKEFEPDVISINSENSETSVGKRKKNKASDKKVDKTISDPEFVKYLELRQDALIDENPQLTHEEIVTYLYQTWLYEDNAKSDLKKSEEMESSNLVKGLNDNVQQPKKVKRIKTKSEKEPIDEVPKEKPKRKISRACYNEEYSDIEEEIEYFEIFRCKNKEMTLKLKKVDPNKDSAQTTVDTEPSADLIKVGNEIETDTKITELSSEVATDSQTAEACDVAEYYFWNLTQPKPNVFKGLMREKVCEICEDTTNLVKCRGCNGMFHVECVKRQTDVIEVHAPSKGRKKKKKAGRKPKGLDDSGTQDEGSDDLNASIDEISETEIRTVDAETLEAQLAAKMKELIADTEENIYDSYSSDEGIDWKDTVPGKCEIVEVKLKPRNSQNDYSDFKCHNCQKHDTPICFVCKSVVSKNQSAVRQKCHVAHCHKYYHLECLDHWPQTQFNGGEPSRNNKKIYEYFEPLSCPRHVCHTCVSDDPRGCKTRFSGDKLARCVRCPATYHSFTKCLPAGTQILTASYIICPRHYQHRPGKVPCHVNTGWCFLCALGGSLICCEYCPTSFHAECLNIKPPEGTYMCEDCETGRLPLYGEMVWVKLGHYRWWPGLVLHPSEIPDNIMAVKHSPGEFVVRFFGQYDHYWVNRGRVFPFQEGDSGRISSQKSKIDAAFTMAMDHARRACEILKTAPPNDEESMDIASSLLPPHYVKLKVNKPCGSLCGRRVDDPESSLTQCECNPMDEDPCGPYSQCLNRMLLTECGPICRAGDRCNNRAFEKRFYPKLVPYRTPSRGWGLKTLEDIKAGQFVIEYVGELIDEAEFRRRMRRMHEIRDENYYFLTLDKERMIDAGPKGNLARFMNHCCEPNCETQKWTVLGDVRVGLFALYDIPANSEVTFNYNLECAGIDKKRCMCGAKRCSGYIGAKPKQDDQTKKNKLPGKRPYNKKKKPDSPLNVKPKPKRPLGRPPKPKELTDIEKDLLIITSATSSISSDDSTRSVSSESDRNVNALKRKRVNFSTEEVVLCNGSESPCAKKLKVDNPVGD